MFAYTIFLPGQLTCTPIQSQCFIIHYLLSQIFTDTFLPQRTLTLNSFSICSTKTLCVKTLFFFVIEFVANAFTLSVQILTKALESPLLRLAVLPAQTLSQYIYIPWSFSLQNKPETQHAYFIFDSES